MNAPDPYSTRVQVIDLQVYLESIGWLDVEDLLIVNVDNEGLWEGCEAALIDGCARGLRLVRGCDLGGSLLEAAGE